MSQSLKDRVKVYREDLKKIKSIRKLKSHWRTLFRAIEKLKENMRL